MKRKFHVLAKAVSNTDLSVVVVLSAFTEAHLIIHFTKGSEMFTCIHIGHLGAVFPDLICDM